MTGRRLASREFFRLLKRRTRASAARVDREIQDRAQREAAILVCDASGFTRRTHDYGILQFLAVMTRCYGFLVPLLRRAGGTLVSARADNILAVFDGVAEAVRTAAAMQRRLRRYNRGRPAPERFHACIGIDVGPVLRLADDVYGAPVNIASKLGEDLAARDEILVTGEVMRRAGAGFRFAYVRSTELGGRTFELHRLRR